MEKKNLIEKFKKLPQNVRDLMFSEESTNTIESIAKKYGLNVEQAGNLADEVGLLMLGENRPRDFINKLERRLQTDPETTKKVAQEINEQIFAKVRESLKKIHAINENETAAAPAPIQPPAPTQAPTPEQTQQTKSPFEQKLEEKVFKPAERPLVKEVEEAKKENRYPSSEDPYREETTNI